KVSHDQVRLLENLVPRVPEDHESGCSQRQLFAAVPLDLRSRPMVLMTVQLHNDALSTPHGIHGPAGNPDVDLRERDAPSLAKREEPSFKPAPRISQLRLMAPKRPP